MKIPAYLLVFISLMISLCVIHTAYGRQIDAEEHVEFAKRADVGDQLSDDDDDDDDDEEEDTESLIEDEDEDFKEDGVEDGGDDLESNSALRKRYPGKFDPSDEWQRWKHYIEPHLIIPDAPGPVPGVNMSAPFELPPISLHEFEVWRETWAILDAQDTVITASQTTKHWFARRGQCAVASHIAVASLVREPCDVENQDLAFEPMFECGWHNQLQHLAHHLLKVCMKRLNETVRVKTHREVILALSGEPGLEERVRAFDGDAASSVIINLHWWLGTSLFYTGKNLQAGWDHFAITRVIETTAARLFGEAYMHETWPQYCVEWNRLKPALERLAKGGMKLTDPPQDVSHEYDLKMYRMFGREIYELVRHIETLKDEVLIKRRRALLSILMGMREMECSNKFVHDELIARLPVTRPNVTMKEHASRNSDDIIEQYYPHMSRLPDKVYGIMNYQYGTFFLYGFRMLAEDQRCAPHFQAMKANPMGFNFFHLGGNIGNEAFYAALRYDLPTVSIEIRCPLVEMARSYQKKYASDDAIPLDFRCADALKANVSSAAIVYLDSEIWDAHLRDLVETKLLEELPANSLVITPHWFRTMRSKTSRWKYLGTNRRAGVIGTTWESTIFYLYTRQKLGPRKKRS